MKQSIVLPLALLAASIEASSVAVRADADCKDVHIFLARGNNEPYPGRQGKLVNAICQNLSSCDYEDIKFYNPGNSNYCVAVHEGSVNGVSQITAYNQKCPNTKLVVSGYSQGADVAGNVLGGGGGDIFGCTTESNEGLGANSKAGKKIAAALLFGDVRHTANQAYNVLGGASHNGVFPRTPEMLKNLAAYGDALRAYCAEGDPICAGGKITADHLNYFDLYTEDAAKWVLERLEAVDGPATTSAAAGKTTTKAPSAAATTTTVPGSKSFSTLTWSNSTSTGSGSGSSPSVSVTVPAYGHDSETITYKPTPVTTVVTEYATVTSECASKGSVYTEYRTITVECPICQSVSEYTKTATGHPGKETKPASGGHNTKPAGATATVTAPGGGSYNPGSPSNSTATGGHYGSGSTSKPTPVPVPSVPVVGTSGASSHLPKLGGMVLAIAALMAF